MADSPRPLGDGKASGPAADRPPDTPRWVKASGVAVIILVVLFFVVHFTGLAPTMQHGVQPP